jgi:serine/threonine protein kinase
LTDLSQSRFGVPLLAAGEILAGRFQIVGRLGEGAIGEVFEATDLELEEQVAIKVLRPEIARDPEVLHRFKREIQLARKVTHPGVCRTFDLFHHRWENGAELAFVTMELLRGETLE